MAARRSAGAGESPGRTLVYLARHGQTLRNESDVLRGLADPPLDEAGHDQAQRLGAALGPRELSAVVAWLLTTNLDEHGQGWNCQVTA